MNVNEFPSPYGVIFILTFKECAFSIDDIEVSVSLRSYIHSYSEHPREFATMVFHVSVSLRSYIHSY